MKATVDQIAPSPSGLGLGVRLEYSENGPVRFLRVVVPWALFSPEVSAEMLAVFNRLANAALDSAPEEPALF